MYGGEKSLKGTVKRWLDQRGYGFIEPEGGGNDIFIHHSEIQGSYALSEGQKVEFELESTPKGPQAVQLKIVD
jgi:CspA family cold shock protein